MYCPRCGWHNADNVVLCANCDLQLQSPPAGTPQQPYGQQVPGGQYQHGYGASWDVPNYLAWSIIVTALSACCCGTCSVLALPFGIVAIVKSVYANNKKLAGDYYGAVADARSAKTWALVCTILVVVLLVLSGIVAALESD